MMEQPFVGSRTIITTNNGKKIEIVSSLCQNGIVSNVHDVLVFNQPDEFTITTSTTHDMKMREIEAQQRVLESQQRVLESQQKVSDAQKRILEEKQRVLEAQERVKESKKRVAESHQQHVPIQNDDTKRIGIALEDDWSDDQKKQFELDPDWKNTLLRMRVGTLGSMLGMHDITVEEESMKKWKVGEKRILSGYEKYGKNKGPKMYEITLEPNGVFSMNECNV